MTVTTEAANTIPQPVKPLPHPVQTLSDVEFDRQIARFADAKTTPITKPILSGERGYR